VTEVNFHVGDEVKKGDVLIRLDTQRLDNDIAALERRIGGAREEASKLEALVAALDRERDGAMARAKAELAEAEESVRAESARLRAEEERRAAEERDASAQVAERRREADRQRDLVAKGAVARVEAEKADVAVREAEARLERARVRAPDGALKVAERRVETAGRAVEQVDRQFAPRRQEHELRLATRRAEMEADERRLANHKLEREQCEIRAHVSGVVTTGEVRVGDLLTAGKTALAIAQQKGLRVDAAVPAAEMGHVKTEMAARVKLDAFDYQKYGTLPATVYHVPPDSQSVEGRGSVYVVRMSLDRVEFRPDARAKLGMTGTAEIIVGRERLLWVVFRQIRQKFETD
jgi:multidrug resistance efflux pump